MNAKLITSLSLSVILLVGVCHIYNESNEFASEESSPFSVKEEENKMAESLNDRYKEQVKISHHVYEKDLKIEYDPDETMARRKPRKIYVDLGAGCGDTYYRHRKEHEKDADEWEAYLWEPNPQMHEFYLNDLKKEYPNVHIIPLAAGVINGSLKLFIHKGQEHVTDKSEFKNHGKCSADTLTYPSAGSTIFKESRSAGEPVNVKVVDFPSWMKDFDLNDKDKFIFKLEIEGEEFEILDHMLSDEDDDTICFADQIKVAFHPTLITRWHAEGLDPKYATYEDDFPKLFKEKCGRDVNMELLH